MVNVSSSIKNEIEMNLGRKLTEKEYDIVKREYNIFVVQGYSRPYSSKLALWLYNTDDPLYIKQLERR
ncbi:hypothetical protein CMI37_09315 [Candidatus Pacearchaeota archaeon]|nr:hypothetical protein [Candidatus Pacearchaeota archaeon]|tara:strand:+ start:272 stop:475 length:204 start_codon:yes stop_codon:yes gene_type:complete